MAKRYVEECDLCKKEAELDNSLTIKPNKSKKTGRSYDVCNTCKELLEKALVSPEGLSLFKKSTPVSRAETSEIRRDTDLKDDELELPDGSIRHIPSRTYDKKSSENTPHIISQELPEGTDGDGNPCLHMNRSPARINAETNKVEQMCKDCNTPLPFKSARTKAAELNIKPIE